MKTIGILILGLFGTFASYFVIGYTGAILHLFTLPLFRFESKIQMNQNIIQKTYDADNALYNYHWFKERFEAIDATKTKIAQAKVAVVSFETSAGVRKDWTFEDKTEYSRLNSIVQGLQSQLEDIVAEYNARAKEVDRAIFQNDLPLYIGL